MKKQKSVIFLCAAFLLATNSFIAEGCANISSCPEQDSVVQSLSDSGVKINSCHIDFSDPLDRRYVSIVCDKGKARNSSGDIISLSQAQVRKILNLVYAVFIDKKEPVILKETSLDRVISTGQHRMRFVLFTNQGKKELTYPYLRWEESKLRLYSEPYYELTQEVNEIVKKNQNSRKDPAVEMFKAFLSDSTPSPTKAAPGSFTIVVRNKYNLIGKVFKSDGRDVVITFDHPDSPKETLRGEAAALSRLLNKLYVAKSCPAVERTIPVNTRKTDFTDAAKITIKKRKGKATVIQPLEFGFFTEDKFIIYSEAMESLAEFLMHKSVEFENSHTTFLRKAYRELTHRLREETADSVK